MGYEAELLSQINRNCKEFPPYAPLSDYNVFHTLGISAKEVIMCRFLADLVTNHQPCWWFAVGPTGPMLLFRLKAV